MLEYITLLAVIAAAILFYASTTLKPATENALNAMAAKISEAPDAILLNTTIP